MGRGTFVYLSYTALVLLAGVREATADLWTVDIDRGPAPSPEDGPPFSAKASRDMSLLPYQIIGIVGSYLCSIFIIGTLLLTVARRSRRQAQRLATSNKSRKMVKPLGTTFGSSPLTPESLRSWCSPQRLRGKKSATMSVKSAGSVVSPGLDSVCSFDADVIEADRQRRAEEMERLYAAVMAQDDRRSQMTRRSTTDVSSNALPEYSRQKPSRLTEAPSLRHLQTASAQHYPQSPKSPVRAIYPPDGPWPPMPTSPTSPIRAEYPTTPLSPTYPAPTKARHQKIESSGSAERPVSPVQSKKLRKSLRSLKISAPFSSQGSDYDYDGARTPLSPRTYTDPGIPPDPPTGRTVESVGSAWYPPTTPGTADTDRFGDDVGPEREQFDAVRSIPHPYPQRQAEGLPRSPSEGRVQSPPLSLRPASPPRQMNASAASVNNTLPLRQYNSNSPSSSSYPFPLQPPASAGPIKTTFVETRRDRLVAGTPKTGLVTPYSAYMPFTPLTPVTPHLSTRAERKQRKREERAIQGVITEEDQVADDKDLWDEGY